MTAGVPPEKWSDVRVEGAAGTAPPVPPAPLDESHFLIVRRAAGRRRPVRSAARTAAWDAGITLTIGLLGLLLSLAWWSWLGVLITAAICAIGVVGLVGRRAMSAANPSAARILGLNQIAFMSLIVLYCVIQMLTFSARQETGTLLSGEVMSQLRDFAGMDPTMLAEMDRAVALLVYGFYSLVILVSICGQGGLALYYFTRRRHLEAFRRETPEWVRRLFVELGG